MRRRTVVLVTVLVALAALVAAATLPAVSAAELPNGTSSAPANGTLQDGPDAGGSDARIVELYPNPVAAGNRGEYLVVRLPERGNWSLDDGYHDAAIPANASGEIALAMDPSNASAHVDDVDVHGLDDYFPLAATGDRIELRRDGRVVDVVEYGRVRDGYRWRAAWGEWRPDGYEPRSAEEAAGATVTPFVLPDSPDAPIAAVSGAEERLLLAGYTLESARVVDALVAAADRGVTVRVLIEGTPVGGFSERGASVGDRLDSAGVDVRVLDGNPDRFRFHHAKYAVADDRAVVLTENWKASGTGGRSNRGWGVVAADERVADDLAALFENDAAAGDTREWTAFRRDAAVYPSGTANDTYPARFEPPPATAADVTLLTAPGNAADRLVARIDEADDRALAIVPRTGGPDERVVHALRRAADRGVDARLLLSGAWYDRDRNRELAASLADEPIDVAVAEPRGRFGKVHAKGVVVDDAVVVGSLNYNEVARTENREVLLAIESAAVADFYARAYAADWRGGGRQLPMGLLGGFGIALAAGLAVARREVTFV
ncbi:phospholipase [Halorubrum sp. JWXQ-INN 858]|uniref:phospholipase D-like domain-containing protein n=1 Tax=Halorubrum sp. JWXQ-INN 858 TaxID=2690782 RepID=UPI0013FCE6C2|nr:phospholipase D-like domain-containing protein [Halorubrum sp. JWXQ-INN 858]MWV64795.1 phospholipase [Halorubrum sp. JWXQ-INN 858]